MLTTSGRVSILVNLQVNVHNLKREGKEEGRSRKKKGGVERRD